MLVQIRKMRRIYTRLNIIMAVVVMIVEIAMYNLLRRYGLLNNISLTRYVINYVLTPAIFNFSILAIAQLIIHFNANNEKIRNCMSVLSMVGICAVTATFHNEFVGTMVLFLIPILVSTVYADKMITLTTGICSYLGEILIVCARLNQKNTRMNDEYMLLDTVIALIILTVGLYLAIRMIDVFGTIADAKAEEEKKEKIERMGSQMITTLVNTIEAKDPYTNGHSNRVWMYARQIAICAGKDEEYLSRLYYMSILHDIGKIGIPDSILINSGRLTSEEYQIIKTHPQVGAEILVDITEMPGIEVGARSHHERYDGTGYPDGIAGKMIPEEARIIAVADAYDAMTSERSYRTALKQEQARSELLKGRGTQFDPEFADIMISLIDKDTEYAMRGTLGDEFLDMAQLRALLICEEEKRGNRRSEKKGLDEIRRFLRRYAMKNHLHVQLLIVTLNDKNGISAGKAEQTRWLKYLLAVIKHSVRKTDTIFQLGISQYLVILTELDRSSVEYITKRIEEQWSGFADNPGYQLRFEICDIFTPKNSD